MARTLLKAKGRRLGWSFAPVPHHVLESQEYAALGASAVKLLMDLYAQYRGANNGDFTAAWSYMKKRGWRSKDTLGNALAELLEAGWITKTRQGGKHVASLFAVTWKPIDHCGGKLDVAPTHVASNAWRRKTVTLPAGQCGPVSGSVRKGNWF
jgi:hypothetical protein